MGNCCSANQIDDKLKNGQDKGEVMSIDMILRIVRIQKLVRGNLVRKKIERRRELLKLNTPSPNEATPLSEFPVENMSMQVQEILNQIKDVDQRKLKKMKDLKAFENCVYLPTYLFHKTQSAYQGEWENKQRCGIGKQLWASGSYYNGYWKNDMANGYGRLILADGDYYEGYWRDDRAHGQGTYYHYKEKSYYIGEWEEDQPHGKGKEKHLGDKLDKPDYEGQFQHGKRCGKGTFTWKNKSTYNGDFNNNLREGYGIQEWCTGERYEGEWLNDNMHGHGTFSWPGGKKYQGQYLFNKQDGEGEFYWPDGRKYKGQWREGKMHGEGVMVNSEGKVLKGFWENGKRLRQSADKFQSSKLQAIDDGQNQIFHEGFQSNIGIQSAQKQSLTEQINQQLNYVNW